jgi:hypothetical protein
MKIDPRCICNREKAEMPSTKADKEKAPEPEEVEKKVVKEKEKGAKDKKEVRIVDYVVKPIFFRFVNEILHRFSDIGVNVGILFCLLGIKN